MKTFVFVVLLVTNCRARSIFGGNFEPFNMLTDNLKDGLPRDMLRAIYDEVAKAVAINNRLFLGPAIGMAKEMTDKLTGGASGQMLGNMGGGGVLSGSGMPGNLLNSVANAARSIVGVGK